MRTWLKYTLAGLALVVILASQFAVYTLVRDAVHNAYVVGFDYGTAANRVQPADMTAYTECMAYYHNASHCYADVIGSWQR